MTEEGAASEPGGPSGRGRAPGRKGAPRPQSALDAACRYLGYRARSESEVRMWLEKKGFARGAIDSAVGTLKSRGLVDDVAFARYWKEYRDLNSPRGRVALRSELARKGIDREVAAAVLDGADDEAAAYRAAQKKAARLAGCDYGQFRTRLGAALRRRGFGYEVIEGTVNRLWQESWSNE